MIIVEDIIDTGRTLKHVVELLKHRQAASVKVVTLLDKPERREEAIEADYVGVQVPIIRCRIRIRLQTILP